MTVRIFLMFVFAGLLALQVQEARADEAKPVRLAGSLTKIDGRNLTIKSETDGIETTVTCNDATQYKQDGSNDPVTFDSFKVGQKVRVYYRAADKITLTAILANAAAATTQGTDQAIRLVGKISRIDGKTVTLIGDTDNKEYVLTVTDTTQYKQDGSTEKVTFDSFKVGSHVRAYYLAKDNTVKALILTKAP